MAKRIKLTVGIPTYKRPGTLRQAVRSVIEQANADCPFDVEVLISFNASEAETLEAVQELQSQRPDCIRYRLNEKSVGYGPNVDNTVCDAKGDFVLMLSDDDMLEPDALATLWNILSEHDDVGTVFLNNTPWDTELSAPLAGVVSGSRKTGGVFYVNGADYILDYGYPPFLVSGVVVKQKAWKPARAPEFLDSICITTQTILIMLSRCPAFVSHVSAIRYRTNATNGGWPSDVLYPFTFELDLLVGYQAARAVFPKRYLRCLHRHSMTQIAHSIMNVKASGNKIAYELLRARLKDLCNRGAMLYWINLALLRMPACVMPPVFGVAKWIRKATKVNA